jgi:hypothetical protein
MTDNHDETVEHLLSEMKATSDPEEIKRLSQRIQKVLFRVQFANEINPRAAQLKKVYADIMSADTPEEKAAAEARLIEFLRS